MLNKKTRYTYFQKFLQYKIHNTDVKQKDLAKFIGKDATYINKIYKDRLRTCPDVLQNKIADFFGLTIEELLHAGKELLKIDQSEREYPSNKFTDRCTYSLKQNRAISCTANNLKNHLQDIEEGILLLEKKIKSLDQSLKIRDLICQALNEKILFFNKDNELIYSSTKLFFMDDINTSQKITIDLILLRNFNLIDNFEEVKITIWDACYKQKRKTINVSMKTGNKLFLSAIPLFIDSEFVGTLIIVC